MLRTTTMTITPSTTHADWRFRYVRGSSPASLKRCSLAEYTINTPRPAMEKVAATSARSTCRQAAVAPLRSGKPRVRGAVVVAMGSVDAARVGDRLGRAAGEDLEDTPGDGRRRRRSEARLLH